MNLGAFPAPQRSMSGRIAQIVTSTNTSWQTGTTILPVDGTIPQSNEGDQYVNINITPLSANSTLKISANLLITASAQTEISVALFRDSQVNAFAANLNWEQVGGGCLMHEIEAYIPSLSTAPTTIKLRAGPRVAATVAVNGTNAGRILGGLSAVTMQVWELI